MDFHLTHFFRTVCEDALLIIDVIRINPSFKPLKESWLNCFTEGLGAVIQAESMELVPSLNNPEMNPKSETTSSSINNKILTGILVEFCYSILLQFSFEELSQYPFWAAKVSLCTGPNSDPPISAFIKVIRDRFNRGGISELFQGCAPYVVGAYLHNIAAVELALRRFFATVLSGIPRSPSMLPKQQTQTQQQLLSSKMRKEFQLDSIHDPSIREETFNNTGLNASSSDSHMYMGTFKHVRSSIIGDRGRDNGRRVRRGKDGNGDYSGGARAKDNVPTAAEREEEKAEDAGGRDERSRTAKDRRLNNIWDAGQLVESDREGEGRPDLVAVEGAEEATSFFPGKSYSNSSSNTINIGLNIDLENELNAGLQPDSNRDSFISGKEGDDKVVEDNIDNDDDGTEERCGTGLTSDKGDDDTNCNADDVSPAVSATESLDASDTGSRSGATVTVTASSSSGSVSDDPASKSSSRLLSSNPSFPSRSTHFNRLFPTSSSSPSFPSSSSRLLAPYDKKPKTQPTCYFSSPSIFQRIVISALAHPFLVVSVKMITNPELRGQNWMYSYVHIVSRSGFGGLYSGIRAALGSAFIPFPHSFLFGMVETVVYRCMLDQGIVGEGSAGPGVGLLSAVTSAVVVHKVTSEEGIYGMARYGLLTAAQVIPGFCAFLMARSALWMVLGDTKSRRRQFSRRKEILEEYWRCRRGSSLSERLRAQTATSSSSPTSMSRPGGSVSSAQSASSFFPSQRPPAQSHASSFYSVKSDVAAADDSTPNKAT